LSFQQNLIKLVKENVIKLVSLFDKSVYKVTINVTSVISEFLLLARMSDWFALKKLVWLWELH